jgi:triphosphoribosyl-dephospho-CoA synthase
VTDTGPITDRAARAFLGLLATEPDTLVATAHGPAVARDTTARARAVVEPGRERGSTDGSTDRRGDTPPTAAAVHSVDRDEAAALATAFVDEGINPGTTADLTCAGLYVALRHGVSVGGKTSGGDA